VGDLGVLYALFILVGGLSGAGIIDQIGSAGVQATDQRWFLAATVLLFGSAVLGAFVDNIPYTAAMLPVVYDLVASDPAAAAPLWWAFALAPTSAATPPPLPRAPTSSSLSSQHGPASQ
jgi:Na+/H+ antiporter NhaD/arsenite permease-like protein